jgi:hypothetical protein
MSATSILKQLIDSTGFVVSAYLDDLAEKDWLRRAAPGVNHITWQVGHLIKSEHDLVEMVAPGTMPALPAGFGDRYTKETAKSDDPKTFHSKAELLRVMNEQRAGTIKALEKTGDQALDKDAPESMRQYAPTVGSVFGMQATHWMMHAGQWVVVRRQLGLPAKF